MEKFYLRASNTPCKSLFASEKVATRKVLGTHSLLSFLLFISITAHRHLESPMPGHAFDLPHGNHGKKTDEQQEAGKEQPKAANQNAYINLGGIKHAPAGWQVGTVQRNYNDDEALEPHSNVYQNRNYE